MSNPPNHSESENLCVVCCKPVDIYSVGVCNHYVCFECSTRMRVLCSQNECPICRGQMPKVIFTQEVRDFANLHSEFQHSPFQDRKYGLIFCSDKIRKEYQRLLEFRCGLCSGEPGKRSSFYGFQQLKDHMRREHGLLYCDLCVENLKIFPFERRSYTKQELGQHRRTGDRDNTSHRGHPLCEFCDTRFMDSDELFRHLRRNHLFCHFCDADGKHQYYDAMDDLRNHFRDEHHLCEQGDCLNMPLVAVFRTDIDLKAHVATEHGKGMSRAANKQARTLEVEFTLAPRSSIAERHKRQAALRSQAAPPPPPEEEGAVGYDEPGGPGGGQEINPQDFPALGNAPQIRPLTSVNFTSKLKTFNGDDFPRLGSSGGSSSSRGGVTITTTNSATGSNSRSITTKKPAEVTITRTVRGNSSSGKQQNLAKNAENFPRLGPPTAGTSSSSSTVHFSLNNNQTPKVSIHVNHNGAVTTTHITSTSSQSNNANSQRPTEAFPALGGGGSSTPKNHPQWVQQKPKKSQQTEPKASKVAPAPVLPPSDLTQFPTLSKSGKKSSNVTVWPQTNNNNNNNSKSAPNSNNNTTNNNSRDKTNKKNKKKTNSSVTNDVVENNTQVKKRSELKIGELSGGGPPGLVKPPPGFDNFPVLGNDLTFTSSSGQTYAIKPMNYHQPANFTQRNQNLIRRSMDMLNNNDMIKDFKSYSALFRKGDITAQEYHSYCKAILSDHFDELFPELLVLLPDVSKQQELFQVCETQTKRNLIVCEKCKQIVFKRELADHYSVHSLESQFPSLGMGTATTTTTNSVWKK